MTSGGVSRQRARGAALQVLFAVDIHWCKRDPTLPINRAELAALAFADASVHTEIPQSAVPFARELVTGVCVELERIDAIIERFAQNWRVERMATVDRNVLRLAVWELLGDAAPAEVIIDQAVELARRFGGDGSPAFVNGVLDAIARADELRPPMSAEA